MIFHFKFSQHSEIFLKYLMFFVSFLKLWYFISNINLDSMVNTSISANRRPIQLRGPNPNGRSMNDVLHSDFDSS